MKKEVLKVIDCLLREGKEPDTAMVARNCKGVTPAQVYDMVAAWEEEGIVIAFALEMCCGEDYIIKEVTEKGHKVLASR